MKKYILLIAVSLTALAMTACKDDGHSLNTSYTAMAIVDNPGDKPSGFVFNTDGGRAMWVAGTSLPYGPQDGSRILANYSLLYDRPESDPYDHYVKLNDYYKVLTKDAILLDGENEENIANDPIYVRKIWVSGGFINIDFVLEGNNKIHYLNLVSNTLADYGDDKIHLEFRHNKNEDAELLDLRGIASFNPDTVLAEGTELPLNIVIHWKTPSQERSYEITYDKKVDEEPSSDNISSGKAEVR